MECIRLLASWLWLVIARNICGMATTKGVVFCFVWTERYSVVVLEDTTRHPWVSNPRVRTTSAFQAHAICLRRLDQNARCGQLHAGGGQAIATPDKLETLQADFSRCLIHPLRRLDTVSPLWRARQARWDSCERASLGFSMVPRGLESQTLRLLA